MPADQEVVERRDEISFVLFENRFTGSIRRRRSTQREVKFASDRTTELLDAIGSLIDQNLSGMVAKEYVTMLAVAERKP